MKSRLCNGYPFVLLRRDRKAHGRHIHRLVLTAFCGPCPAGCEACHNDGSRTNNNLTNLRWDTRKANCADQVTHGVIRRGELNGKARMTKDKVLFIRKQFTDGTATEAELAEMFGVHRKTINCIKRRETWAHV